jgi:neutrophil cytosolic factor 2
VAASDPSDTFTTFTGSTRLKQGISPTGVYIDRPDFDTAVAANLSRSLTVPATSPTPSRCQLQSLSEYIY